MTHDPLAELCNEPEPWGHYRAISRADLDDDVRGINASLELIGRRRTPLTEELLEYDVDVSWWVTPDAYDRGYHPKLYLALWHWVTDAFPFTTAYYSNREIPDR
jgi:hypothetical protein